MGWEPLGYPLAWEGNRGCPVNKGGGADDSLVELVRPLALNTNPALPPHTFR